MTAASSAWEGGCLCGRVRYRATVAPMRALYCHCRMCQKAYANAFGTFVTFPRDRFAWLGEEPRTYRSSDFASRAFCPHCGSQLVFAYDAKPEHIGISLGSLDRAADVAPTEHWGTESMLPWLRIDDGLPRRRTEDDPEYDALTGKK